MMTEDFELGLHRLSAKIDGKWYELRLYLTALNNKYYHWVFAWSWNVSGSSAQAISGLSSFKPRSSS